MSNVRAALIGLGSIAWKLGLDPVTGASLSHAAAFRKHPDTTLVGAFSPNKSEAEAFSAENKVSGFTDLDQMLTELHPDLVSICSPNEFHPEHLQTCMRHAVPMVWLEKPVADRAETIHMLETQRLQAESPSVILVNYQRRYTETYRRLRHLMREQVYGRIESVDVRYSRGLRTNGSHVLDLIFFLLEPSGYSIEWAETECRHDNPSFVLRTAANYLIHVDGIEADYHNIDFVVTCAEGRLSILHGGMTLRCEERVEHELFPGYYRLKDARTDPLGTPGFDHSFDKALADLIECYRRGADPQSSLATAWQGQNLLDSVEARVSA